MKKIAILGLVLGLLAPLAYGAATVAYRLDEIGTMELFGHLQVLVPILLGAGVVLAISTILLFVSRMGVTAMVALLGAMVSFAMAAGPIQMRQQAKLVPAIHDISTDTESPPVFIVTAAERTEGENPAEYDREQTEAQLGAYPDIKPIDLDVSFDVAFDACLKAAKQQGLRIADENRSEGRIEAVATTRWFGFTDDVVFRVSRSEANGVIVDIRSKSRVGRSDLGANATRIRQLRDRIMVNVQ